MILRLDDAVVATFPFALDAALGRLTPAELGLCDGAATELRRLELASGRAAAHEAFVAAGVTPRPSVLRDDDGRPRIDPPGDWFVSLAHDRELAAAAVSRSPVGVDLLAFARAEQVERVVAERVRTGRARSLAKDSRRPFPEAMLLWTAWEALGKRTGEGVFGPMREELELVDGDVPSARSGEARVRWFEVDGQLLCLAGPLAP